jgi:hypothetical protein
VSGKEKLTPSNLGKKETQIFGNNKQHRQDPKVDFLIAIKIDFYNRGGHRPPSHF